MKIASNVFIRTPAIRIQIFAQRGFDINSSSLFLSVESMLSSSIPAILTYPPNGNNATTYSVLVPILLFFFINFS